MSNALPGHVGTAVVFVPQYNSNRTGWSSVESDWISLRTPCDYVDYPDARAWADAHAPTGHQTRVLSVTMESKVVES